MSSEQDLKHINDEKCTNGKSYKFGQLYVRVNILNVECTCMTASFHREGDLGPPN